MILTGSKIVQKVNSGQITIIPFDVTMVNPNSYNYCLGDCIAEISDTEIDPKLEPKLKTIKIPSKGYLLRPNKLYLGHTHEAIGSSEYVVSLIGRSSVGRLGLYMQITADLGQLGKAHKWTLELKAVQPIRVYPRMRIGQVSFWKPKGTVEELYLAGYSAYNYPQHSMFHAEEAV